MTNKPPAEAVFLRLVLSSTAMTAPIYTRGKALAQKQLGMPPTGKGAPLTLSKVTAGGEYIPGGGDSAPTVTDYLGSGIRTSYKLADMDGALVQAGDVRFLVAPLLQDGEDMPAPAIADTITFGGIVYQVVNVRPWDYDGETTIGFVVQGRA